MNNIGNISVILITHDVYGCRLWYEVFFWFLIERMCCRTPELLHYG